MRKKKGEGTDDASFAAQAARARLTPVDIQQKEFRLAFRGYNERDVDEFLDRLTEDLAQHIEENRRLREQGGSGGTPSGDASGEAERIVAEARAEAARIVREAEERGAVLAAAGGGGWDSRAIVAPYLNREREFLQSLGQLVQGHAEAVKGMVQAHREAATLRVTEQAPPTLVEEAPAAPAEETVAIVDEQPEAVKADQQRSLRELFWGED